MPAGRGHFALQKGKFAVVEEAIGMMVYLYLFSVLRSKSLFLLFVALSSTATEPLSSSIESLAVTGGL